MKSVIYIVLLYLCVQTVILQHLSECQQHVIEVIPRLLSGLGQRIPGIHSSVDEYLTYCTYALRQHQRAEHEQRIICGSLLLEFQIILHHKFPEIQLIPRPSHKCSEYICGYLSAVKRLIRWKCPLYHGPLLIYILLSIHVVLV